MKGVKQLANSICGYFLMYCLNFVPVLISLTALIIKEMQLGAKYTNSLYSGGIIGSIAFLIVGVPSKG